MAETKPLDGISVLAVELMQSLPYATQMLARLGADVVKVEHPEHGDAGRSALPAIEDPEGRQVGSTFLRNNLYKKSICIDLKNEKGRQLVLDMAPHFDIFAENFKAGALKKMDLGYESIKKVHPKVVYLSISGFGNTAPSPYSDWPAYAGVAEAMSSLYSWSTPPDTPPVISPLAALGDTVSGIFGAVGVLSALRQMEKTGKPQYVDIAMLDCMVALADAQLQYKSMGVNREAGDTALLILDAFKASDGYFMIQVGREHQWERLCHVIGKSEWLEDERFATRQGWVDHLESDIRPAIEKWSEKLTRMEASKKMVEGGIASGPCNLPIDVFGDEHVKSRNMIYEMENPEGDPVLFPGNPIKMEGQKDESGARVPWLGEHTDEVLGSVLGMGQEEITEMRKDGIIN